MTGSITWYRTGGGRRIPPEPRGDNVSHFPPASRRERVRLSDVSKIVVELREWWE